MNKVVNKIWYWITNDKARRHCHTLSAFGFMFNAWFLIHTVHFLSNWTILTATAIYLRDKLLYVIWKLYRLPRLHSIFLEVLCLVLFLFNIETIRLDDDTDTIHLVLIVGANIFRNENILNSRYQKSDIIIEFCDIQLLENRSLMFQILSFCRFFQLSKFKTWVSLGKICA